MLYKYKGLENGQNHLTNLFLIAESIVFNYDNFILVITQNRCITKQFLFKIK